MDSDINTIFRKYIAAMGRNEAGVAELTNNLRSWAVENGEIVKEKIEKQIDEAAIRMGFVKASDLDSLMARISDLESRIPITQDTALKEAKKKQKSKVKTVKKSSNSVGKKKSAATKKEVK